MCCFTRPVQSVSKTKIFARDADASHQYLVYSMNVQASVELAMVLPIPTPADSPENAVKFLSLEEYPEFFADMGRGFPSPPTDAALSRGAVDSLKKLEVVEVGSFEASFVPTIKDFSRLDARFRLADGVWEELPQYADFGFAVFKLKPGAKSVHPMAFRFPRRDPRRLFFPTVHIHDGQVHERAKFDHALYCQLGAEDFRDLRGWRESPQPAGLFMKANKTRDIVDPDGHVYLRTLRGQLKNQDMLI